MEPLKACVSGRVNYPLKPVTPGYQDAALTEVKRPNTGPNPLKALLCTRKLTAMACVCLNTNTQTGTWFTGRSVIE